MNYWPEKIPYSLPNKININVSNNEYLEIGLGTTKIKCEQLLTEYTQTPKVLLTPSCTSALEMCALLLDLKPGDEVILPSFTFVTSASAFALRGAKLVFVDIRPDTLNINESLVEAAITKRTKAIVAVHYAGVACELNQLKALCQTYNVTLIEDAAQALGSFYNSQPLGTFGELGCYSFHYTKNIHAGGEGGALSVNTSSNLKALEVIQEKGTNRNQFLRGEVDKYTWQRLSSSYVISEIQARCLFPQLKKLKTLTEQRLEKWDLYYKELYGLCLREKVKLPAIPKHCQHNGHIFYLIMPDKQSRDDILISLNSANIEATTHFVPLHSSPAGIKHSTFSGDDKYTTNYSNRLIRLPIHSHLTLPQQHYIIDKVTHAINSS